MKQTLPDGYTVKTATMNDTTDILYLLRDVAYWLKATGEKQWEAVIRGEEDAEVIEAIKSGFVFIVRKQEKIAGMFILFSEQTYWDEWLWGKTDQSAIYLHKLALASGEIGNGLGRYILHWIEAHLLEKDIGTLRLDCISSNENLNLFYQSSDYTKVGVSKNFSLFEKKLKDS